MNQPKPPPQTLQPDDERKIQIFLERASSIVLERPVLDVTHWRRLVSLAEELGLSDEELRIGFAEIDTNHSGNIDFKEFAAWWMQD